MKKSTPFIIAFIAIILISGVGISYFKSIAIEDQDSIEPSDDQTSRSLSRAIPQIYISQIPDGLITEPKLSTNVQTKLNASDATSLQGKDLDSTVATPSDGHILVFRDSGDDWILETKPVGGNPLLNDITDVNITGVTEDEVVAYDTGSGDWINQTPAEAGLEPADATILKQDDVGTTASTVAAGNDSRFLSTAQKTDLTDTNDSSAHYHAADRARANHTGTQTASTISDFDTEVGNHTDVAANTSARHVAATGGNAITVTGQDIAFDGGAAPGGQLGGTWGTPTIDDLFVKITGGDTMAPRLTISDDSSTPPLAITMRTDAPDTPSTHDIYLAEPADCSGSTACWKRYNGASWDEIGPAGGGGAFTDLTDTPSNYTTANAIYTTNATPDGVNESTVVLTENTNTFNITKGTATFDVAADADLNIDTDLTVNTTAVTLNQSLQTTEDVTFNDITISTPLNIYSLSHDSFADFDSNEHMDTTAWAGDLIPDADGTRDLGAVGGTDFRWANLYLSGNLSDETNTLTVANAKTAYDHSQASSQSHTDYLLNTGADTAGSGAGFIWTFDASAGTDSQITFGDGVINVSAGELQEGGVAVLTSESDPNALLTADTDNVNETHIDWGSGANQVDADSLSDGSTNAIITLTQETNFGTAYTHSQNNSQEHTDYFLNTGADTAGSGAGFAWTFDASAGTDAQITFGDGTINVSTGELQEGGNAVFTTGDGALNDDDLSDNDLDDLADGTSYERVAANQLTTGVYIDATTAVKGIASFNDSYFAVASGDVSIDDNYLANDGDAGTGTYDFGAADDFEIPNGSTPTVDTQGQIAIDTSVDSFSTGFITYYDDAETMMVVAMPTANFGSPTGNYVIGYNGTNQEFELQEDDTAAGGAASGAISFIMAASDETTTITTGTNKVKFRMPYGVVISEVRASVTTASTSGVVTVDINEDGTTILSTKLTIDANEKTSESAAIPAVVSDSALADDAEISVDIDTAGTGATGLKVTIVTSTFAGTFTPTLTISDSGADPPLNVTQRSSAPSSPSTHDIYLDDGTNCGGGDACFRRYTGSVWEELGDGTGTTAWNAIGDPSGDGDVLFGTTQQELSSILDAAGEKVLTIDHTDTDVTNATTLVQIQSADDGDPDLTYLKIVDATGGTPNSLFEIGVDGQTTWEDSSAYAPLNITERSSAPTTPATNDLYLDDGTGCSDTKPCWKRYNGAGWEELGDGGAGGSMAIGGAVGSGTAGSVLFVDGSTNLGQDNANFFWDTGNARLGLGTATPNQQLELTGNLRMVTSTATDGNIYKGTLRFLHNYGTRNTFLGENAGNFTMSAIQNTGFGHDVLKSLTTGNSNTSIGTDAGEDLTEGTGNVFVGQNAGTNVTTGSYNFFLGSGVGDTITTESNNVGIGGLSMGSLLGSSNVGVGYQSLQLATDATYNTCVGGLSCNKNTTGDYNTNLGGTSGRFNQTGSSNTWVGYAAGEGTNTNSHSSNVGIGRAVGLALTTGSNNVLIGFQTGNALTSGSTNILIGYDVDAQSNTANNQMSIGNLLFSEGIDGTGTSVSSGNLGVGVASPDTRLDVNGAITGRELSADPSDPDEGSYALWMSDGTGSGDDGDIMVKVTAGGSTKTITLIDFSAF